MPSQETLKRLCRVLTRKQTELTVPGVAAKRMNQIFQKEKASREQRERERDFEAERDFEKTRF